MTSTPMVTRLMTASDPAEPPAETSRHQGTPVERQMAAILESLAYQMSKMITTLQEQLTNLITEVLKLQQQPPVIKVTTLAIYYCDYNLRGSNSCLLSYPQPTAFSKGKQP